MKSAQIASIIHTTMTRASLYVPARKAKCTGYIPSLMTDANVLRIKAARTR